MGQSRCGSSHQAEGTEQCGQIHGANGMREDPGHKERQKVNKISKNGKKRKDRFVKNLEGERTV